MVEEAIAYDRQTRDLELTWGARHAESQHRPEARALDAKLDRNLSAFSTTLEALVEAYEPETEIAKHAAKIHEDIFPLGVSAITRLTYVEQYETVTTLLARLQGSGRLVKSVAELNLTGFVEQIAELNRRYRATLNATGAGVPTGGEVRDRQAEGQWALLSAVAWVLGHFVGRSPKEVEARDELLSPIVEQNQAIRIHRRGRRRVVDVDPDTGGEIEEPGHSEGGAESPQADAPSSPAAVA